jgi:diaminopimelate decarboxylase
MQWLHDEHGVLHGESVSLEAIAERFGTPTYVYSRAAIEQAWTSFAQATRGRRALVCYALKANSNLAVIDVLARAGAGFDIVSGGELARVVAAGGDPARVVFSGVGKSEAEIRTALQLGVKCFNVESASELRRLSAIATALGRRAPVSLRVNPNVDAGTHPYISTGLRENKFGVAHDEALELYREAARLPGLAVAGIDCHIGSQITEIEPFLAALDKVLELAGLLDRHGITLQHLDLGGGLGIRYRDETPPSPKAMMDAVFNRIARDPIARDCEVLFEFGRAMVGNAGLLLTRVEYLKHNGARRFAIVDAAMNDLLRPALYEAWHDVRSVRRRPDAVPQRWEIVGPVCESGDWLARDRELALAEGDLLAILSAGAYGMAMSSNYNTRPRAAEVMIDGRQTLLVRERESVESLYALERRLDDAARRNA